MRVKCLAQEHNTNDPVRARTGTSQSGVQRASDVPIIDYNRSLIENLKRRDNRLWKMLNRLSRKKVF